MKRYVARKYEKKAHLHFRVQVFDIKPQVMEDRGQVVDKTKTGGIDFNANQMNMNVSKEGNGVGVNFDSAMVEQIRRNGFEGFVPVIINIQPLQNIRLLLDIK
jgi:hypothetical protein